MQKHKFRKNDSFELQENNAVLSDNIEEGYLLVAQINEVLIHIHLSLDNFIYHCTESLPKEILRECSSLEKDEDGNNVRTYDAYALFSECNLSYDALESLYLSLTKL